MAPLTRSPDKATVAKAPPRLCRVCGCPLLTHAESLLGVHIGCVADRKFVRKTIRSPGYGFNRKSNS